MGESQNPFGDMFFKTKASEGIKVKAPKSKKLEDEFGSLFFKVKDQKENRGSKGSVTKESSEKSNRALVNIYKMDSKSLFEHLEDTTRLLKLKSMKEGNFSISDMAKRIEDDIKSNKEYFRVED